jgi:hypothetical protein
LAGTLALDHDARHTIPARARSSTATSSIGVYSVRIATVCPAMVTAPPATTWMLTIASETASSRPSSIRTARLTRAERETRVN